MRHPSPSVNLAFSPAQLAIVLALHAALGAVLLTADARALVRETAPLQVRMIPPEPLPVAPPPPQVRAPAPAPKPVVQRRPQRAPEPLLAVAKDHPSPTSPAPVELPQPVPVAPAASSTPAAASSPVAASTPVAAAAPEAPAPTVTAPRFDADYLDNPAPVYPAVSRRLGEQGKVVLRVFVEADGRPARMEVRTGSGSPRLDDAAMDAVRRWKFVPARRGQEAVGAWVLVPLDFQLKG